MTGSPRSNGGGGPGSPDRENSQPAGGNVPPTGDDSPGVPGFRTWSQVYWFVFGFFGLIVIGLTIFTEVFG